MRAWAALLAQTLFAASFSTVNLDVSRDNANTSEAVLTPSNVTQTKFGKVGTFAVDGDVYAQPLYIQGVTISTKVYDVLYVATMHDSVYAFDANTPNSSPLWMVNLGTSYTNYVNTNPSETNFYLREIGCVSTPVVDASLGSLYCLCVFSDGSWKLFDLDITTGSSKVTAVTISGQFPGTGMSGDTIVSGNIQFQPLQQLGRPGLTLANANVYLCFGSYADVSPYHGWVFSYSASTLTRQAVWNSTPTNSAGRGAIWQGGAGMSVDGSGNLYVVTGNGGWDGTNNFGESVVELSSSLSVLDWFTPSNHTTLDSNDWDFGAGHVIQIGSFVLASGKYGQAYLLNQGALGHLEGGGGNPPVAQSFQASSTLDGDHGFYAGLMFMNSTLYVSGELDNIRAYSFNGSTFNTTAAATSSSTFNKHGAPMTGSSNAASNAIVWATTPASSADATLVAATLRAFNSSTLAELYNSGQNSARDAVGNFAKFSNPTVANGRVYVPTLSGVVDVFGLLPSETMRGSGLCRGECRI